MNYGNTQSVGQSAQMPAEPTPMTRDLNVLGESLAQLEMAVNALSAQLGPITRPTPEPMTGNGNKPQLVTASRSSMGSTLEGYAAQLETQIGRLQILRAAVEV